MTTGVAGPITDQRAVRELAELVGRRLAAATAQLAAVRPTPGSLASDWLTELETTLREGLEALQEVVDRLGSAAPEDAGTVDLRAHVTSRESEILRLIGRGVANRAIAAELGISEKTVRNHVSNLYEKLAVRDRAQAALYAVRVGLVEL